jgi:hypothetical protein
VDVQFGLRHLLQQFGQARARDGIEIDHVESVKIGSTMNKAATGGLSRVSETEA